MAEGQHAAGCAIWTDGRVEGSLCPNQLAQHRNRDHPWISARTMYFPMNQHDLSSPYNSITSPKSIAESVI